MVHLRCKTCMWWDNKHPLVKTIKDHLCKVNPGICRKHKPGAIKIENLFYGVQPIMDGDEFCGEWKADKG